MARNVIYLEWKEGFEFFGSPASMYDKHTDEELGINIHSLNNVFCQLRKEGKPLQYVTKTGFTIRKGEIILKETGGKAKNYLGKAQYKSKKGDQKPPHDFFRNSFQL